MDDVRGHAAEGRPDRDDQDRRRDRRHRPARNGATNAHDLGIHPQLSALEMLVYPKTRSSSPTRCSWRIGTIEVLPPVGPFTLFVWGAKRVLPVRLNEFTITEEPRSALNPIRAKVSMGLRVLSYNDLSHHQSGLLRLPRAPDREGSLGDHWQHQHLSAVDGGNVKLL